MTETKIIFCKKNCSNHNKRKIKHGVYSRTNYIKHINYIYYA